MAGKRREHADVSAGTLRQKATDITRGSAWVLDHDRPAAIKREKSRLFSLHKRDSSDGGRQKARHAPPAQPGDLGLCGPFPKLVWQQRLQSLYG